MEGVHHALRLKYDYETSDSVKYKEKLCLFVIPYFIFTDNEYVVV